MRRQDVKFSERKSKSTVYHTDHVLHETTWRDSAALPRYHLRSKTPIVGVLPLLQHSRSILKHSIQKMPASEIQHIHLNLSTLKLT